MMVINNYDDDDDDDDHGDVTITLIQQSSYSLIQQSLSIVISFVSFNG